MAFTFIMQNIRRDLFRKISSLNVGYFNEQKKGEILSCISNDVTEVQNGVANSIHILFREPLLMIGFLVGLFLGIISTATAPAAAPRPMVTAHPVTFMFLTPFGNSMPWAKKIISGKVSLFAVEKICAILLVAAEMPLTNGIKELL